MAERAGVATGMKSLREKKNGNMDGSGGGDFDGQSAPYSSTVPSRNEFVNVVRNNPTAKAQIKEVRPSVFVLAVS